MLNKSNLAATFQGTTVVLVPIYPQVCIFFKENIICRGFCTHYSCQPVADSFVLYCMCDVKFTGLLGNPITLQRKQQCFAPVWRQSTSPEFHQILRKIEVKNKQDINLTRLFAHDTEFRLNATRASRGRADFFMLLQIQRSNHSQEGQKL